MKHRLVSLIVIFIFALLQHCVFPVITLISITPNLLMGATAAYAIMRGPKEGILVGLICGLIVDVFSGNLIGTFMLIYSVTGFFMGFFNRLFFPEEVLLPLGGIAVGDIIYGIVVYLGFFFIRGNLNFGEYLLNIILPEALYTLVCMILFYPLILRIEQRFIERDKGNANKFA